MNIINEISESIEATNGSEVREMMETIRPEVFYFGNTKVHNHLTDKYMAIGGLDLNVSGNKKKEILTSAQLFFSENVTLSKEFTNFDVLIHDAICSLYVSGNKDISVGMVYKAIKGGDGRPTEAQYKAIEDSLDKCLFTCIEIDYTAEAQARGYDVEKTTIRDSLIHGSKCTVVSKGRKMEAYELYTTPVLYKYAQLSKQIVAVPINALDTGAAQNTEANMLIKAYLLKRIEVMKRSKGKKSNVIRLDTTFKETGITITSRIDKSRKLKDIRAMLDTWKAEKIIKDYIEVKEGRTLAKVKILY